MKVTVTGATGAIGREIVKALRERGDEVTALSRDAGSAREKLGEGVRVLEWQNPKREPPPAESLAGQDAVIHMLGEPVAQRWTDDAKREIRESRVLSTQQLVEGLRAAGPRPSVLVSQSASGFYGPRGDEEVDEGEPPADDFLAQVTVAWESAAQGAESLGVRVALPRTGVVLTEEGGALEKMLPFFKLGIGGPVAGGRQYVPWVHVDDVVGALLHAVDTPEASGPLNLSAPRPATNKELSKALGRVLRRPAFAPVPAVAIKTLYGGMASIVTTGVRMVPRRLEQLGYRFSHEDLNEALRAATGRD